MEIKIRFFIFHMQNQRLRNIILFTILTIFLFAIFVGILFISMMGKSTGSHRHRTTDFFRDSTFNENFIGDNDYFNQKLNFRSTNYLCIGNCFCFEGERRVGTSYARLSHVFTALSALVAYKLAKTSFEESCVEQIGYSCKIESIISSVESCEEEEKEVNKYSVSGGSFAFKFPVTYYCEGKCIDREFFEGRATDVQTENQEENTRKFGNPVDLEKWKSNSPGNIDTDFEIYPQSKSELREFFLKKSEEDKKEIFVYIFHKIQRVGTPIYDEMIEEALSVGWIDGGWTLIGGPQMMYKFRFVRRLPKSIWCQKNLKKMRECVNKGKATETGMLYYNKWLKKHPDDEKSHCEKFELKKEVEVTERFVKRGLQKKMYKYVRDRLETELEYAEVVFMNELDLVCSQTRKRGDAKTKVMAGNNKPVVCFGHENYHNPTVKCGKNDDFDW